MKRWQMFLVAVVLTVFGCGIVRAAGGQGVPLQTVHNDLEDMASLQRGAQIYMNYCSGCHSLQYTRYKGLAKGIGIVDSSGEVLEKLVQTNLNFVTDKVTDNVLTAMPAKLSEAWFGVSPPDMSLITRYRGSDWLYSYLKSFYADDSRPFGVNNAVFPDVGMSHVLWELQGIQKPVYAVGSQAHSEAQIVSFDVVEPGALTTESYDMLVTDLVNFLEYVGEPHKTKRQHLGVWVMLFLIVFTLFAYLLKREYWKDVN